MAIIYGISEAEKEFLKKEKEAINFLHEKIEEGINLLEFSKSLIHYLRHALILKMGGDEKLVLSSLTKEEVGELKKIIKDIDQKYISNTLENFLSANNRMKYSPIAQLPLELAVIDSCIEK